MRRLITGRRIWVLAATLGGVLWIALLPALGFLFYNLAIWQQEMDAGGRARQRRENTAAERLYRRALAIYAQVWGKDQTLFATLLCNLADACASERKYAAAEPLYRRAQRLYIRARGSQNLYVAYTCYWLARLYESEGQYVRAEPSARQAAAIYAKVRGHHHLDVADSLGV